MSDYLTRLAERTLGHARAIRPMLTPLFAEPVSAALEEPSIPGEPSEPPRGGKPARTRPIPAPASETPSLSPPAEPGRTAREENPAPTVSVVPLTGVEGPEPRREPAPQLAPRSEPAPVSPPHAPITPADAAETASATMPAPRRPRTSSFAVEVASEIAANPMPAPLLPPARTGQTGGIAAGPGLSLRDEARPRGSATRTDAAIEATPPVVRISIGRIDVRATPAPRLARGERVRATEREQDGLSLRDYLAGRTGNGAAS